MTLAWPPTIYEPDRTNDTNEFNLHPSDHNEISVAITEIVAEVNRKFPLAGGTMTGKLRLTDTGDVSLASTGHAFQIGGDNAANLAIDVNEIQARNNGAAGTLVLNQGGGAVTAAGVTLNGGMITGPNPFTVNVPLNVEGYCTANYFSTNDRVIAGASGAPLTNYGIDLHHDGLLRSTTSTDAWANMRLYRAGNAASAGQNFISFNRGVPWGSPTNCGEIAIVSSNSVAYHTTCDARLKERTGDADDALDVVSSLGAKVYRGRWIADDGDGDEWVFLNAQDAQSMVPFTVSGEPDGDPQIHPMQMDHSKLVPLLLAAVSQLAAKVDALT